MSVFNGAKVVFTGTLNMKRSDAEAKLKAAGGSAVGAVSKNVQFLVAGVQAGSKLDDAKAKGIPVLSEQEFLDKLEGKTAPTKKKEPAGSRKTAAKDAIEKEEEAPKPKKGKAEPKKAAPAPKKGAAAAAGANHEYDPLPDEESGPGTLYRADDGTIYGAWLIQMDFSDKKATTVFHHCTFKSYILQLLSLPDGSYAVTNRWGKAGETGQVKRDTFKDLADAQKAFKSKFRDKTKNDFAKVGRSPATDFVVHEGKYKLAFWAKVGEPQCPHHHKLVQEKPEDYSKFHEGVMMIQCNECGEEVAMSTTVRSCHTCNWGVCEKCRPIHTRKA